MLLRSVFSRNSSTLRSQVKDSGAATAFVTSNVVMSSTPELSLSEKYGGFAIDLSLSGKRAIGAVGLGVFTLSAIYYKDDEGARLMRRILERAFSAANRWVGEIGLGSLLVKLHCCTAESFVQFLEDYESGKIRERLIEELLKNDIKVESLTMEIKNMDEVKEHREKLRKGLLGGVEEQNVKEESVKTDIFSGDSTKTETIQKDLEDKMSSLAFDQTSNVWIRPFSELINCMFPVEYVYGDWLYWKANSEANRADPECITGLSERDKEAGSRFEGFCIPQFIVRKKEMDLADAFDVKEHWQPDSDKMIENDSFVENDEKSVIPIFTAEHVDDDPRYAKLRLTPEWKDQRPRYKNVSFLHHSYLLPPADHPWEGQERTTFDGKKVLMSYSLHGPVRKLKSGGFPDFEEDRTGVFKYPDAWPEPAMDWLVRMRRSGWPSPDLVQEIFDSGCHLAPVGRGKRVGEPIDKIYYVQNPEATVSASASLPAEGDAAGKCTMDETEWRTSFSMAENKLGESVTPVQRHVMVLLKMIKKFYFPDVISTYYLKNLLFWECENKDEVFWKEENSACCLFFMLDRLQECLEKHDLPHYIMSQSNLLKYEDPSELNKAAVDVAEVRRNILPKTVSLLRRLQSMTYQSQIYLQTIGLQLENLLLKMQNESLAQEDRRELLKALLSVFVRNSKFVIRTIPRFPSLAKENERLSNVTLYTYQSILGRNLCKLWFVNIEENKNQTTVNENEFTSFVKTEIEDLSAAEDFLAVALIFFDRAVKGVEPSLAIPSTNAMGLLREEQMKIAYDGVQEANAPMKGILDLVKNSDLDVITERGTKKLQAMGEGTVVTKELMYQLMNEEFKLHFSSKNNK